jgi:hypothetical protein
LQNYDQNLTLQAEKSELLPQKVSIKRSLHQRFKSVNPSGKRKIENEGNKDRFDSYNMDKFD